MASSAQTPLLSPEEKENKTQTTINNASNNNEQHQELHFYESSVILNISREMAFGYLILLTGGEVQYEPPTMQEVQKQNMSQSEQGQKNSDSNNATSKTKQPSATTAALSSLDESTASLAYAAIVDGNVLHACFGLKASASGSAHGGGGSGTPTIIGDKNNNNSSSLLCCFPGNSATLDALQLVLPQVTKNKLRLQNLVEILREVMDLHYEELESNVGSSGLATPDNDGTTTMLSQAAAVGKEPVYIKVIQAYTHLFTSIVRYHDTKKHILDGEMTKNDKAKKRKKKTSSNNYCTGFFLSSCIHWFSKSSSSSKAVDPKVEQLHQDTLANIKCVFEGLKEDIWECLERTATKTEFTGMSYE